MRIFMYTRQTKKRFAQVLMACLGVSHSMGQDNQGLTEVYSRLRPYTGPHHAEVDVSTLRGKVMAGYQGWFAAEGDGSGRGWFHYAEGHTVLKPGHCTFDLWPDMSEMDEDERFATPFTHSNGQTAYLFSSFHGKTVARHFQWMKEYGIDGVFLQRFGVTLKDPAGLHHCNVVAGNVRAGANAWGRTWAMMYDLSGLRTGEIRKIVMEDWKQLVDKMEITQDKSYLRHNGKPVVAVWGIGFNDNRQYTLAECEELVHFLKTDEIYGGNTLMLGVPTWWRHLRNDAINDTLLHQIILQADIVSPWTVGRYNSPERASQHAKSMIASDIEWTQERDLDYLPVVFPGFSWQNLMKTHGKTANIDQIPRLKGQFLWSQVVSFQQAGAEMLYVAMFDEIDEATAIFKCTNDPPVGESNFLTYEGLPSDHYLWLVGKAGQLLRGEIPASERMPVRKGDEE